MPNPTKRRAAFSDPQNGIYDKGITTSGNDIVIYSALLVMTLLHLRSSIFFLKNRTDIRLLKMYEYYAEKSTFSLDKISLFYYNTK